MEILTRLQAKGIVHADGECTCLPFGAEDDPWFKQHFHHGVLLFRSKQFRLLLCYNRIKQLYPKATVKELDQKVGEDLLEMTKRFKDNQVTGQFYTLTNSCTTDMFDKEECLHTTQRTRVSYLDRLGSIKLE